MAHETPCPGCGSHDGHAIGCRGVKGPMTDRISHEEARLAAGRMRLIDARDHEASEALGTYIDQQQAREDGLKRLVSDWGDVANWLLTCGWSLPGFVQNRIGKLKAHLSSTEPHAAPKPPPPAAAERCGKTLALGELLGAAYCGLQAGHVGSCVELRASAEPKECPAKGQHKSVVTGCYCCECGYSPAAESTPPATADRPVMLSELVEALETSGNEAMKWLARELAPIGAR